MDTCVRPKRGQAGNRFSALRPNSNGSPRVPKSFAYVVGALLGDGCVYQVYLPATLYNREGNHTWRIILAVTDRSFAEEFAKHLRKVLYKRHPIPVMFSWPPSAQKRGRKPLFRVQTVSRPFGEWWHRQTVDSLKPYALRQPSDFVRGFYDAEGYCDQEHRKIEIVQKDRLPLELVGQALSILGIRFVIKERHNEYGPWYRLRIQSHQETAKFMLMIGTCIERKAH